MFHINLLIFFTAKSQSYNVKNYYADFTVTKRKNRPIPPAPEDNVVVCAKLMEKEQADIIHQQL